MKIKWIGIKNKAGKINIQKNSEMGHKRGKNEKNKEKRKQWIGKRKNAER